MCDFLEQDVPNAAFPWVNEADELLGKIEEFKTAKQAELKGVMVKRVLPVVVGLVVAVVAWRWS